MKRSIAFTAALFAASFAWAASVIPLGSLDGSNGMAMRGLADDDRLGHVAAGIGDFNGDGVDDFIIGAENVANGGMGRGSFYVVFGRADLPALLDVSSLDGTTGFRIDGLDDGEGNAMSAAHAGDINADGTDDFIVGNLTAGVLLGRACVVFGRADVGATLALASLDGGDGFCVFGTQQYAMFGYSVAGIGDYDGDGIDDFAIGAPLADFGGADSGSVFVVFGRATPFPASLSTGSLDGGNGFRLDGSAAGVGTGWSVAGADVAGDNRSDLVVGSPDMGGMFVGSAFVQAGRAGPHAPTQVVGGYDGTNGFRFDSAPYGEWLGLTTAVGDVTGDGIADLMISANNQDATYVVRGRDGAFPAQWATSAIDGANGHRFAGLAGSRFGYGVGFAGDLNGDGIGDAAFGAPNASMPVTNAGRVAVAFGSPDARPSFNSAESLTARSGFRIEGTAIDAYCGSKVGGAGDVNDDGVDDLVLGCHYAPGGGEHRGEAYVVFGNASPMATTAAAVASEVDEDAEPDAFSIGSLDAYYLDAQVLAGAALTATPVAADGQWQWRGSSAGTFAAIPQNLSVTNALVLDAGGELRYVPAPESFESSSPLALRFWDGAGDATPGVGRDITADVASFGGFAADTETIGITVSVRPVNDPPSFTAMDPPAVLQDSAETVIPGWATLTGVGPANESGQAATFEVVDAAPAAMFAIAPAITTEGSTGTLRYRPAPGAYGTATFRVRVRDTGGTQNGGSDTSAIATFTILIDRPDPLFGNGFEG